MVFRFYNNVAAIVLVVFYFVQNIVLQNFVMTINSLFKSSNPNTLSIISLFKYLK
jgi:hypothetical protein